MLHILLKLLEFNTVNVLIDFALFNLSSFLLQPQTVCSIESLSRLIIAREDDITHNVNIYMEPDRLVSFMMEDRDALEFRLVLAGYYKLMTGKSQVPSTTLIKTQLRWNHF